MRMWVFARRNLKELARDPLTLLFGLAFPLVVMLLLSAIQAHVPVEMFAISTLAPGIAVFGLSFVALLSGLLVAKDRCSSFLTRLFSSPMTAWDFILAYCLPMLLLAVAQNALALPISAKNVLRAAVLRNMLQQVFRNAERGESHDHV